MAKAKTKKANREAVEDSEQPKNAPSLDLGSLWDEDLSDVETTPPLLREDTYVCEFVEAKPGEKGEPETPEYKKWVTFVVKTTEPARDVEGNRVNPGYTLRKTVFLTENERNDAASIRRDMARIVKGFGKKRPSEITVGDRVLAQVRNSRPREKDGKTYDSQSEIRSFKPYKG